MKLGVVLILVLSISLVYIWPTRGQEKVRISQKVELSREELREPIAPPELRAEFDQFFKALEQELKAQGGNFNPDCRWLIAVKLLIKPRSKVIEITLDPGGSLPPRIMTTAFVRRSDIDSEEAFKEAIKPVVKLIISRAENCST